MTYSLCARFSSASSIFDWNSLSSKVTKRDAPIRVCLWIKKSGIFQTWDFGISIKYPERDVYLIFKFEIYVSLINFAW